MSNNYISAQLSKIINTQENQSNIILEFTQKFTDFSEKILILQERVVKLEELDRNNRSDILKLKPLTEQYISLDKLSLIYILIPLIVSFIVSTISALIVIFFTL